MTELRLGGGFVSDVVRIGDTVRRAPSPNSGFVQVLLRLLEQASWSAAPRFQGIDAQGREILSFVEGHVPLTVTQVQQVTTDQSLALCWQYLRLGDVDPHWAGPRMRLVWPSVPPTHAPTGTAGPLKPTCDHRA